MTTTMKPAEPSHAAELQSRYELDVFGKRGITLMRGEGARVWDDQDNAYIDCIGGQGAAVLGHAHPALVTAIAEQSGALMSCPGSFYHPERARLMERLSHIAPVAEGKVFLCNSGTEAVEAALKFARAHTGRAKIVAAKRGFHGRTYGAMSATFNPSQHELFGPVVPGMEFIGYNQSGPLEDALRDDVAALLIELVQGEGGVHPAEASFVDDAATLCRERGVLLIIDEIQTGFGRTGKMFACAHYDLSPDIVCLAKGLGGGFPMGAVVVRDGIEIAVGTHGTTFGGNPVACAAANAVIDVLESDGFLPEVTAMAARLRAELDTLESPVITEVRGLGMLVGLQLKERVRPFLQSLATRGVLALPAGPKVLRLLPPLIINEREVKQVTAALRDVLQS